MQQIPNIVKFEDKGFNSLTVKVGSEASDENFKKNLKTNLNKQENKKRKLKNVKIRTSKVILRLIQKN